MNPNQTVLFFVLLLITLPIVGLGCYGNYSLGFPGPFDVNGFHTTLPGNIPITVFYPDIPNSNEKFPVIIFSAGFIQPRATYEGFARQLAQWGFVAVIRTYPSLGLIGIGDALLDTHVSHVRKIIDWLETQNNNPNFPLYQKVDTNNVGVTGHSLGATVSICAALVEPRIRAVVSLDVTYNGGDFDVLDELPYTQAAFMYIRASSGGWCSHPVGTSAPLFEYTPPPTVLVVINGADHMDFMDRPIGLNYFGFLICPPGPADDQLVRDLATKYMVAWFNVHLKGLTEFQEYYCGQFAKADEDAGLATFHCKLEK